MEIWKDIKGYEGLYQISNLGNVKSLFRYVKRGNSKVPVKEKILIPFINHSGYYLIGLNCENGRKTASVHRLVALAFIENPENKLEVNHINGIKTDNRVENLEWNTHTENMRHAVRTGLKVGKKGADHPYSKLTENDVLAIRNDNRSQRIIAKEYGVDRSTIGYIKSKRLWPHI